MSGKPKHARRLSLFGLGTIQPLLPGEQTPRPNTNTTSIAFPDCSTAKQANENGIFSKAQAAPINRKLSKKRKSRPKTEVLPPSPPPTAFSFPNAQLSDRTNESDVSLSSRQVSLKRKTSMNLRMALSSIFVPKPSRKKVAGFLDGMEGISGGRAVESRKDTESRSYAYESRSPSPPSPEIRPPSGLGQIADSIDLSNYAQDEYEGSVLASFTGSVSRTPSMVHSITTPTSEEGTANTSPMISRTKSLKSCESGGEMFYVPSLLPRTAPSQVLKEVLDLTMPYCSQYILSSLARASREFLQSARAALYTSIDSDDLHDNDKRRRRVLQTIAGNPDIASLVKNLRWVCAHVPTPSSPSSLTPKRSIPRRAPTVSITSSPEEYVLPRVLSLVPNLETLNLLQPHSSLLQSFIPVRLTLKRSPSASPISSPLPLPPPTMTTLTTLTLSGRTTLTTTFGAVLVRFLELHPGIRELNLPDVFCLPNVHSLSRQGSNSSSSASTPLPSPRSEIPPVPPLPPLFASTKDRESPASPILPNLTRLTAPLTLATQLVPGRPLHTVNIELTTSLYEGFRPTEVVRALAEARAASSPIKDENGGKEEGGWKAARKARREGKGNEAAKQGSTIKELRMRCTAKVDGRTIGKVLVALGNELGGLELLAIGWNGPETDLHAQITPTISRFQSLRHLDIFHSSNGFSYSGSDYDDIPEPCSPTELQEGITLERGLVEQWSHMCPQLSYIEFTSQRVWKAS